MENPFHYVGDESFIEKWHDLVPLKPEELHGRLFEGIKGENSIQRAHFDSNLLIFEAEHKLAAVSIFTADRRINFKTGDVHHGGMVVWPDRRKGKGYSKVFNRNCINLYLDYNLKRIYIDPGLTEGGYVQARFGFTPRSAEAWEDLKAQVSAKLDKVAGQVPPETVEGIRSFILTGGPESVIAIARLRQQVGGKTLGQLLLLAV
jgi:hypothetical protein